MTITFSCDICGAVMTYEEDRSVLFNSGDREQRRDLCPNCSGKVEEFIDEQSQDTDETLRFRKVRQK